MTMIFKPAVLKSLPLMNRFIRSAACEYMADETGVPGPGFVELYGKLSKEKIGMVITGYSYVMTDGKSNPGQSGIYADELIPAWKNVTRLFENSKTLFLLQIVHGGRQVRPKHHTGSILAPSAVPDPAYKTEPQEMTSSQIREVIRAFIQAAVRAEMAGFDGIQLHVAHGYLLNQFISPHTNRRHDEYGGNQKKRTRAVTDIISGIRKTVNDRFVISAKLNGEDFINGGLSLLQALASAKLMKNAGLDFIEVSGGMAESGPVSVRKNIDSLDQEGYFRDHARAIRRETGIPTAVVGGFRTLSLMQDVIEAGDADFISLCRPFIREPGIVSRFQSGKQNRASCISCNRCFNPRGLKCWQVS
jgi:2,4-dienoyl-CoA reductase-like NADH-dependent reductase (Old Yellow Enzyme family)